MNVICFILYVSVMRTINRKNPIVIKKNIPWPSCGSVKVSNMMLRNICWCHIYKVCSLRMTKISFEKSEDQFMEVFFFKLLLIGRIILGTFSYSFAKHEKPYKTSTGQNLPDWSKLFYIYIFFSLDSKRFLLMVTIQLLFFNYKADSTI